MRKSFFAALPILLGSAAFAQGFALQASVPKFQQSQMTLQRAANFAKAQNLLNQMVLRMMAANGIAPASMAPVRIVYNAEFNAYSEGDGSIVVFTTLLEKMQDDSELAFVLGHEIAHWTLHHQRDLGIIAREMDKARWYYWLHGETVKGHVLEQARQCEGEADRMGMIYAVRAGYDLTAFEKLFDDSKRYHKTNPRHPVPDARRKDLERQSGPVGRLKANDLPAGYLAEIQNLLKS